MAIGGGYCNAKVLLSAVGLGLFTVLGQRSLTAVEIAERLGLVPRPATDFLDTLVSLDLLARDGDGPQARYRNTAETGHFLDESSPAYQGGLLKIWEERNYRYWADLTEALKTGQAQSEIKHSGRPFFETMYADPARLESRSWPRWTRRRGATSSCWPPRSRSSATSGSATSAGPTRLLTRDRGRRAPAPALRELRSARRHRDRAAANWTRRALVTGCRRWPATSWPTRCRSADVITMGMILHDWNLDQKLALIAKAYDGPARRRGVHRDRDR